MAEEERQYHTELKRAFARLAPFYDIMAAPLSGLRGRVVALTGAEAGSRVLDVATGTGTQAFAFAQKGCDVVGVDISEAMLDVARRKNRYPDVTFQVGDAASLPFDSESFDVSCVSFGLHDMPPAVRQKALMEMVRATRRGGVIVVADYALPESRVERFLVYHFVRLYERSYYGEFIRSDLPALLRESGIRVESEVRALLGAARVIKGTRPG